jgi:glutamine amidotransferase
MIGKGIKDGEYVYFVHSYYLKPKDEDEVVFWTEYGVKVPAVIRKDNIIGMQFHPEKSGKTGLKLLKNIKEMIG